MQRTIDFSRPELRLFLVAAFAFMALILVGSGLSAGIMSAVGISPFSELDQSERQWFRLTLMLNNLIMFAATAAIALWFVYRNRWQDAAGLREAAGPKSVGYSTGFFIISLPLVAWLAWVNLQVTLPDWAMRNEEQTNQFMSSVLTMSSIPELIMALLTVAVTPAIGEELLLRGLLQRRVLGPLLTSHHSAIWITAFAFSFMHLEFAGFLPRLLLGATLGYAYHWSRSLWVPIGLHFVFNGLQVMVAYLSGGFTPDTEIIMIPPWWLVIPSLVGSLYFWWKAEAQYPAEGEVVFPAA